MEVFYGMRVGLLLGAACIVSSVHAQAEGSAARTGASGNVDRPAGVREELPPSNAACYKAMKMELANLDDGMGKDVLTVSPIASTHYGTLVKTVGSDAGKQEQFACTYRSGAHGQEVVLTYRGKPMDREGNMRYVWYWSGTGTVVETAGRYGIGE